MTTPIDNLRAILRQPSTRTPDQTAARYERHNARCAELGLCSPSAATRGQGCAYPGGYPIPGECLPALLREQAI